MLLVWAGLVLVALKFFAVGPIADLSWWWVLSPLALAFLWFEVFERTLGFDRRRREHNQLEETRRQRVSQAFKRPRKD